MTVSQNKFLTFVCLVLLKFNEPTHHHYLSLFTVKVVLAFSQFIPIDMPLSQCLRWGGAELNWDKAGSLKMEPVYLINCPNIIIFYF